MPARSSASGFLAAGVALCVCALAILNLHPLLAAESNEAGPWTLESCVRMAQAHHGGPLAAGEELRAAQASVEQARSTLLFPTLSAYSTQLRGGTQARQAGSVPRNTGTITDEQYLVTAEVTLYDGGLQKRNVWQARATRDAAEATVRREEQDVAVKVLDAYLRVLRARQALRIASQKLERADSQKAMISARHAAGTAAGVDVYPVEVQSANARVEKLGAETDILVAGSALRNAMGLEEGPVPDLADVPEKLPDPPPLAQCIEQALASRPELHASTAETEQQRAVAALARLKSQPQLTSAAKLDRGLGGSSINYQWYVYAALTWSLYRRDDRQEIAAEDARVSALLERHKQLLRDVTAEVTQAHMALVGARQRAEASRVSVTMARKNLEVAEAKYRLGLAIPIEIVDAQIASSAAEMQTIQLRYDYILAHARLRRATGQDILAP